MNNKTILMVTPYFPPAGGGLERYAYEIAKRLNNDFRWRVVIITSGAYREKDAIEEVDGLKIFKLSYDYKFSNTPFAFSWFKKIKDIIKAEKPDIINIHTPVPGIGNIASSVSGKVPTIVTYHTGSMRKGSFLVDTLVRIYEGLFLPFLLWRAKKIICVSDFVGKDFLKNYQNKCHVISPGIDINLFKPEAKRKLTSPTVLFVAGLNFSERYKGLDSLIDTMAIVIKMLPSAQLLVVGEGDYRTFYENKSKRLGLERNIIFTGRLGGAELVQKFQEAHIFVAPSTNESFGMAILEAMASGLPIVANKVGGIPDLVENENNGLLVRQNDTQDLAEKILKILSDKNLALQFGLAGRKIAEQKYGWDERVVMYDKVFVEILNKRRCKIVHISPYYPPFLGGLGKVAEEVARQLAADGMEVVVITTNLQAKKSRRVEISKNLTVKRLWAFELFHVPFIPNLFWQLLRISKPAIFHIHFSPALVPDVMWIVSKLRRIPYIVHFHLDVEPSGRFGFIFLWWKKWIQPIIIRDAEMVVTLSPEQKKLIEGRYKKPADQVQFIGNGVGEEFFQIGKQRTGFNRPLRLLFVGRLAVQKRPERLVEAMSLVKANVTLNLVGDGEDEEKLKAFVAEHKLNNVLFSGRLTGNDLLLAYKNADVFVLSSDKEGMPLVLLEAMATGLPIVGSDVLGIKELINDVGILVQEPSPGTFAAAIDSLSKDPNRLRELGQASYNKASEFTWVNLADKLRQIYEGIII